MSKTKRFFIFAIVAGLVFGTCFAMGAGFSKLALKNTPNKTIEEAESPAIEDGERTNILFLGVDARPGETKARSDTMIFASIDPKLKKVALVSIPRDTRVEVKGSPLNKICTANLFGGPKLAVAKVEELLSVDIDYYVQMNFNGFEEIVDTLGGVDMDVEQRMYKPSEGIDLQPGEQRLDGHDALAFVRFRGYVMGDIDRTSHQQEFIKALAQEMLKPKTIVKLPALIKQTNKYVKTDMGVGDMLKMAKWAPGFNGESIVSQTLPGYFYDEIDSRGTLMQSYWVADADIAEDLLDNIFEGKTIAAVVDVPVSQTRKVVKQIDEPTNEQESKDSEVVDEKNVADNEERNWERSKLPSPGHDIGV